MDIDSKPTAKAAAEHYGYSEVSAFRGLWPIKPGVLENIKKLPCVLNEKEKFRIAIDYDPEFAVVLVQVFTNQISRQGHPDGKTGDCAKSSCASQ